MSDNKKYEKPDLDRLDNGELENVAGGTGCNTGQTVANENDCTTGHSAITDCLAGAGAGYHCHEGAMAGACTAGPSGQG